MTTARAVPVVPFNVDRATLTAYLDASPAWERWGGTNAVAKYRHDDEAHGHLNVLIPRTDEPDCADEDRDMLATAAYAVNAVALGIDPRTSNDVIERLVAAFRLAGPDSDIARIVSGQVEPEPDLPPAPLTLPEDIQLTYTINNGTDHYRNIDDEADRSSIDIECRYGDRSEWCISAAAHEFGWDKRDPDIAISFLGRAYEHHEARALITMLTQLGPNGTLRDVIALLDQLGAKNIWDVIAQKGQQ
ncbi:hypothetical protein GCM10009733_008220 [Nonomuraea maheshkhaliensis]|uniref:Uncharacterized protein n=1 Tax=Nonomuraea maheshkhaliensis TaxID=419590 RepID=A0ABN2ESZ7_9ACTN